MVLPPQWRTTARRIGPLVWLAVVALATWVLADRLRAVDFEDILRQLRALPMPALIGALLCSCGVYVLVGLYEGIAVRLATRRKLHVHAFRTALTANPIGRAIGFAVVSGGALRYRMYAAQGLTIRQIGAVIVLAGMPYFFAVGWLIDFSLLLHPEHAGEALRLPPQAVTAIALLGFAKDIGWLIFVWRRNAPINLLGQSLRLPSFANALLQIAFGLAQVSLMTGILYLLMPPELGMSWPAFIAIYCIAFVAGQISNVPAGLGVLEAALLLMLPHVPPAKLLGAVIAYRAIYEMLPLLLALVLLAIYEIAHPAGVVRDKVLRK